MKLLVFILLLAIVNGGYCFIQTTSFPIGINDTLKTSFPSMNGSYYPMPNDTSYYYPSMNGSYPMYPGMNGSHYPMPNDTFYYYPSMNGSYPMYPGMNGSHYPMPNDTFYYYPSMNGSYPMYPGMNGSHYPMPNDTFYYYPSMNGSYYPYYGSNDTFNYYNHMNGSYPPMNGSYYPFFGPNETFNYNPYMNGSFPSLGINDSTLSTLIESLLKGNNSIIELNATLLSYGLKDTSMYAHFNSMLNGTFTVNTNTTLQALLDHLMKMNGTDILLHLANFNSLLNGTHPPSPMNGTYPQMSSPTPKNESYPPMNGTYPPMNGTYPPMSSQPPMNGSYPPMNGTYPPMSSPTPKNESYPPMNGTYPPMSSQPPMNGSYPPMNGTYPPMSSPTPKNESYPPMNGSYPPMNGTYPPMSSQPPMNRSYPPMNGTYPSMSSQPPMNGSYPPMNGTYPPMSSQPPMNGSYPPMNGTYSPMSSQPPMNGSYPPMSSPPPKNESYPPMNGTYSPMSSQPPMNGSYPPMSSPTPKNESYPPMNGTYSPMSSQPPMNGSYPPMNGTYPPMSSPPPKNVSYPLMSSPPPSPISTLPPKSTITPLLSNPVLANLSAETLKLVNFYNSSLLSLAPEMAASLDKNKSSLILLLDGLNWQKDCITGMVYYKLLEEEFIRNRDPLVVTFKRLLSVVPCKQDCFFDAFLRNNYTNDPANFSLEVMKVINPDVLSQCQNTIVKLLPARNVTNSSVTFAEMYQMTSNGSLPLDALMTKTEIANIQPADVVNVISTFGSKLDGSTAMILASKIPANANFSQVAELGANLRAEVIGNASNAELLNNLNKFASKCDDKQALVITNSIVKNGDRDDLMKLLNSTDLKFANKIPYEVLKNKSISITDLKNIPDTLLQDKANTELSGNKTFADLSASNQIIFAPKINQDHIAKITPAKLINILGNISSSTVVLKSNQRAAFLENILKEYAGLSDIGAANKFDSLDAETVNAIGEIIVNSNSSIYKWLRTTNNFVKVIEKNSKISSTKCCSFLYQSRALYASEAIRKLVPNKVDVKATHLDSLGACFAGLIPAEYIDALSTTDFKSQLSYFKIQSFQPNSTVMPSIKTKLEAIYNALTTDTERTTFISDIGSLIVYMNVDLIPTSILKTSASTILTNIKNDRDLTSTSVQKCRVGSGDDTSATTKNQDAKKSAVKSLFARTNRKRRQAATTLTCDLVNTIISAIDTILPADFTDMPLSEYTSCIQVLGQTSNQMSSEQYAALAAKVSITSLTDSDILSYNKILTGYSSTDLAKLSITSVGSIQVLGKIQTFSSDQLYSLVSAIKKEGDISATKFSYMGNLACGMSQSDLDKISNDDFKSNIKSLSVLDAKKCPSISILYAKAKTAMAFTSPDSVTITEIDSLAAGITTSEAAGLDTASVQALSSNALYMMPAEIVNSFSLTQIKLLSSDQLSSVLSNPNSGSFSSTTKTLLENASQGVYDSKAEVSVSSNLSSATVKSSSNVNRYEILSLILVTVMSMLLF